MEKKLQVNLLFNEVMVPFPFTVSLFNEYLYLTSIFI